MPFNLNTFLLYYAELYTHFSWPGITESIIDKRHGTIPIFRPLSVIQTPVISQRKTINYFFFLLWRVTDRSRGIQSRSHFNRLKCFSHFLRGQCNTDTKWPPLLLLLLFCWLVVVDHLPWHLRLPICSSGVRDSVKVTNLCRPPRIPGWKAKKKKKKKYIVVPPVDNARTELFRRVALGGIDFDNLWLWWPL